MSIASVLSAESPPSKQVSQATRFFAEVRHIGSNPVPTVESYTANCHMCHAFNSTALRGSSIHYFILSQAAKKL